MIFGSISSAGRRRFSCCPTFSDSLSFLFTFFPSLTCVISFFTPTSLPPLYPPSSINLQSFLSSQQFFTSHFGSIHLITLHLLSTLGSPFFPHFLIHFSLCSFCFYDIPTISQSLPLVFSLKLCLVSSVSPL